jgi:hypothetical protein
MQEGRKSLQTLPISQHHSLFTALPIEFEYRDIHLCLLCFNHDPSKRRWVRSSDRFGRLSGSMLGDVRNAGMGASVEEGLWR